MPRITDGTGVLRCIYYVGLRSITYVHTSHTSSDHHLVDYTEARSRKSEWSCEKSLHGIHILVALLSKLRLVLMTIANFCIS